MPHAKKTIKVLHVVIPMSVWNLKTGELDQLKEQNAELKRVLLNAFNEAIENKRIAAHFRSQFKVLKRQHRHLEEQFRALIRKKTPARRLAKH